MVRDEVDRRVTELFTKMAAGAGTGDASAVDEMKRLHAAVVAKQTAATTLSSYVPQQVAERLASGDRFLKELSRDMDSLHDLPSQGQSEADGNQL